MKEVKQECCNDLEAREGQGRRRTYRTFTLESCRSSAVDYNEETSQESPRKMQDEQEVTSEASWNATAKRQGKKVRKLRARKGK